MNPPKVSGHHARVAEIEDRLHDISAKIAGKSELLNVHPTCPALTDRQIYEGKIATIDWSLRNTHEPMLANFKRLQAEAEQRLDDEKKSATKSRKDLENVRFSSNRLASAIDGSPCLVAVANEMDALEWLIECEPDRIRSAKAEVVRIGKLIAEKHSEIRRVRGELNELKAELHNFDVKFRAQIAAERELMTGWVEATEKGETDSDAEADSSPENAAA